MTLYEAEVAPLQRLLVDVPVSGGAWLYVPPPADAQPGGATGGSLHAAGAAATQQRGGSAAGWRGVEGGERVSSCDIEVVAPWQAVCCLTPDATQLADPAWSPFPGGGSGGGGPAGPAEQPEEVQAAAAAAKRGDIAGLRMMLLDVLSATADGSDRCAWHPLALPVPGLALGGSAAVVLTRRCDTVVGALAALLLVTAQHQVTAVLMAPACLPACCCLAPQGGGGLPGRPGGSNHLHFLPLCRAGACRGPHSACPGGAAGAGGRGSDRRR